MEIRHLLGSSVSKFNRRLRRFHRFSHVTCPAIATFQSSAFKPKSLQTKIPKIGVIGGYLSRIWITFDSCVQVRVVSECGTFWVHRSRSSTADCADFTDLLMARALEWPSLPLPQPKILRIGVIGGYLLLRSHWRLDEAASVIEVPGVPAYGPLDLFPFCKSRTSSNLTPYFRRNQISGLRRSVSVGQRFQPRNRLHSEAA